MRQATVHPPLADSLPEGTDLALSLAAGPLTETTLERLLLGSGVRDELGLTVTLRGRPIVGATSPNPPAGDRLHLLWQILVPEVPRKELLEAREVIVIPDAALHLLRFEALVVELDSGGSPAYWLDRGPPIRYAPSLRALQELESRSKSKAEFSLLTLSNPDFNSARQDSHSALRGHGLASLPETRKESEAIQSLFPRKQVVSLEGASAREEAFLQYAPRARFLHLATHGIVSEDDYGLLAALVFTPSPLDGPPGEDGFLHLFELYDLHLDAELAVLSACETELGRHVRGEGVFALSRGFLSAGCRRTVASLWPVADESTAFLIADFFRRLAALDARSELVDYARALRDAKRALRTQPTWQDPYYWAPFVLSGSR